MARTGTSSSCAAPIAARWCSAASTCSLSSGEAKCTTAVRSMRGSSTNRTLPYWDSMSLRSLHTTHDLNSPASNATPGSVSNCQAEICSPCAITASCKRLMVQALRLRWHGLVKLAQRSPLNSQIHISAVARKQCSTIAAKGCAKLRIKRTSKSHACAGLALARTPRPTRDPRGRSGACEAAVYPLDRPRAAGTAQRQFDARRLERC